MDFLLIVDWVATGCYLTPRVEKHRGVLSVFNKKKKKKKKKFNRRIDGQNDETKLNLIIRREMNLRPSTPSVVFAIIITVWIRI